MCVVTCTLVVAKWMSAPAWTSRSTTSVWPFQLATYTGLKPSCVWQQQKIVRVWNTISTDSMCLKFKAEHAEDNPHSESLLHEKVSWYWLWSVQQWIHTTWCIHCCCTGLLLHTTVLYIYSGFRNERVSRTQPTQFTYSISLPFLLRTTSFHFRTPHITKDRLPGCCHRQPQVFRLM